MTKNNISNLARLLPDRHPQQELFICDVADAVLKDILPLMEHPFYSLSKKPDTTVRYYEHNGNSVEITPSVKGIATIYDKDILIFCISQIMAALRQGRKVSQWVRINCHELLMFTNRGTSGRDYKALKESLDRLDGTRIRTNIKTANEEKFETFGLIEASILKRTHGMDGRLLSCEVKLSDWVFNAIRAQEVLTLHPDYFRLRKPLERRVYELARKHCGQQVKWSISLNLLLKKSGSKSPLKRFRQLIGDLANNNHLPDYAVTLEGDLVTFLKRQGGGMVTRLNRDCLTLHPDTYNKAKKVAPRYDIYALEQDWRNWQSEKGIPKNADAAFVGFCKNRYARNPNP